MTDPRFTAAIEAIDAANADDPTAIELDGRRAPKELVHGEEMTRWLERLDPDADDLQHLAARAHHVRRWEVPRSSFPDGRAGYLRWRTQQKKRHAELVGAILAEAGYPEDAIDRVGQIVRKEGLGTDPQVQTHEDALCLVFLRLQFAEYSQEWGDEKTAGIVRKTAAKMSERGLGMVGELGLSDEALAQITGALA